MKLLMVTILFLFPLSFYSLDNNKNIVELFENIPKDTDDSNFELNHHIYILNKTNNIWYSYSFSANEEIIHPIIDIDNGYLSIEDTNIQGNALYSYVKKTAALFIDKRKNKYLGYYLKYCSQFGYAYKVKIFKIINNQYFDMTDKIIPKIDYTKLINKEISKSDYKKVIMMIIKYLNYELPRFGTTITLKLDKEALNFDYAMTPYMEEERKLIEDYLLNDNNNNKIELEWDINPGIFRIK